MNNSKNNTRKRILFVSTLIALVFSAQSNVILNGATFPLTSLGNIGDFYMNTATNVLFGVKDITVSGAPIASDAVLRSGGGTPPPLQRSGTSKTKLKGLRTSTIPSQGSGSADPPPPQDGGSGSADPPADESTTGGADGSSAFEVWQAIAGNEEKTLTDYLADIKGEQGETGPTGSQGNSSFEVWQSISGNETKTLTEYLADIKGVQGEVGIQGLAGVDGSVGPTGIQGTTGVQGIQGEEGFQGITGAQGEKGDTGSTGNSSFELWQSISGNETKTLTEYLADIKGVQGEVGIQGAQGSIGPTGIQGLAGVDGSVGPTGIQGIQGEEGVQGITGAQGKKGDTGLIGNSSFELWQSISGNETKTLTEYLADIKGVQGEVGIQGAQGSIGPTGIQGTTGVQGIQGEEGVQGITGAQGEKGDAGLTGSSSFEVWQAISGNEAKTLTDYQADIKGEVGVQGEQGLTGATGSQGEKGDTGLTGSSSFKVWQAISGNEAKTLTDYQSDIKGEVGVQGEQGLTGATGSQGIQGEEGVQGITGAQGDKGDIGLVGSSSFEVWQAISGNEAKTLTDYQADIKGEVGVQGEQGLIGATGAAGTDGLDATNSPKDCPLGYVSVNDNYCIQADENTPSNWFDAVVTCTTQNAQLCTWANWYGAVATQPLLANTTNNWEWLDDGGDDDSNYAKVAGNGNAKSHNSEEMETAQAYRCCFPR